MFGNKMTLNQSNLIGHIDDLQDLTIIERPIRRSLKVFLSILVFNIQLCSSLIRFAELYR